MVRDQKYWLSIKQEAQDIRKNLARYNTNTNSETRGVSEAQPTQEPSTSSFKNEPICDAPDSKITPALTEAKHNVHAASQMEPIKSIKTESLQTQSKPQPIQFKVQSSLPPTSNVQAKSVFDMFDEEKKFYEDVAEEIESKDQVPQKLESTQKPKIVSNVVNNWTTKNKGAKSKPQVISKPTKNVQVLQTSPNVYVITKGSKANKNTKRNPETEWLRKTPKPIENRSETKVLVEVPRQEAKKVTNRPKNDGQGLAPQTPTDPKEESKAQIYLVNRRTPYLAKPRMYPSGIPRSFLNPQDYAHVNTPDPYQYNLPSIYSKATTPLTIQTQPSTEEDQSQQYSPSNVYEDTGLVELQDDNADPTETRGQKRLSAFQRLGPAPEPKKPKLTINLLCSEDQSVREVVDLTDKSSYKYEDVHLRDDVLNSTNEVVKKYLPVWPWKKHVPIKKSATVRASKNVMLLQLEQMEEAYEREYVVICVSVTGYPPNWNKEDVLDAVLDSVKGKLLIPLYIDFKLNECRFFVMKCKSALVAIHKFGFIIRKNGVELKLTVSQVDWVTNSISLYPKNVLRDMLSKNYDGERKLSLKEFTLGSDISNFMYYPLNCLTNQSELLELKSDVIWEYITDLDLSQNRLTSLDGFNLPKKMPRLKNLDLSNNYFDKMTVLLNYKALTLRSIKLEGNPLCTDYTDPSYYVKVLRMIFPTLKEIDGIPIHFSGDIPKARRNYCVPDAKDVVEKFLDTYFPLLETEERKSIANMYSDDAVLSVTYRNSLRSSGKYIYSRSLFNKSRVLREGDLDCIEGAGAIARHISKWPSLIHDPYSFTVEVMHHDDFFTILRVGGMMKLTSESLADDEHVIAFTRTLVLHTYNGVEYKIRNEMVYWDEPSSEWGCKAFQRNAVKKRQVSLQLESVPNEEMQNSLVQIFMKITELDEKASYKCLEVKDWNFKEALQHFIKLLKLDGVECLRS